jgi:hypothetical protein
VQNLQALTVDGNTCKNCPFCDKELVGPVINGLHATCNETFQQELDQAFPDQVPEVLVMSQADIERLEVLELEAFNEELLRG